TPYGWRGEYFANRSLSGTPRLVRDDPVTGSGGLAFNWGSGSPSASLPTDAFSVRWTRQVALKPGTYRFTATSDDGIRVWADDHLVINEWHDHPAQTNTADVSLAGTNHTIVVEYYENRGDAVARVSWEPLSSPPQGWRGEYYANRWLSGPPTLVRDDLNLGFNWSYGSPASTLPKDNFSVRWTRTFRFQPGSYRFTTTTDDGVRLWVNEHLLIDQWYDQALSPHNGTLYLSGDVPIKMEYYEHGGLASAWLTWDRAGGPVPQPPGAVVVDDDDQGFVEGGSWSGWRTASEGYDGSLTWTRNNQGWRANYNWARWYPGLAAGRYEVFVYIPYRYSTTSQARYWVSHRNGYTLRVVNQSANGNRWVSLGTYWFRGSREDYVSLADVTFEPVVSRLIAYDAVKWEPR
ncbi:MAG: PA14 domain-containing protein, partial [Anaerolineae bacterium]